MFTIEVKIDTPTGQVWMGVMPPNPPPYDYSFSTRAEAETMARILFPGKPDNYRIKEVVMKQGQRVLCNGYMGTVMKVCDGQLAGMIEVRVPGGLTCVDAKEVTPVKTEQAEFIPGKWYAMCFAEVDEKIFPGGALLGKYEGDGCWSGDDGEEIESIWDPVLQCRVSPNGADCYVEQI